MQVNYTLQHLLHPMGESYLGLRQVQSQQHEQLLHIKFALKDTHGKLVQRCQCFAKHIFKLMLKLLMNKSISLWQAHMNIQSCSVTYSGIFMPRWAEPRGNMVVVMCVCPSVRPSVRLSSLFLRDG